jgi:hypothetical protein
MYGKMNAGKHASKKIGHIVILDKFHLLCGQNTEVRRHLPPASREVRSFMLVKYSTEYSLYQNVKVSIDEIWLSCLYWQISSCRL